MSKIYIIFGLLFQVHDPSDDGLRAPEHVQYSLLSHELSTIREQVLLFMQADCASCRVVYFSIRVLSSQNVWSLLVYAFPSLTLKMDN